MHICRMGCLILIGSVLVVVPDAAAQPSDLALPLTSPAILAAQGTKSQTGVSLENTTWTLIKVRGTNVTVEDEVRPAILELDPTTHRASGSGGCNRISGSYALHRRRIVFSRMASTKMACIRGMEIEDKFLEGLQRVRRWEIRGHFLELLDVKGSVLAELTATGA